MPKKKPGKKRKSGKSRGSAPDTCSACKNFRAGKKRGWCARKDKKRAPEAEPCGSFDPR